MDRLLAMLLLAIALGGIALFQRVDRREWRSFRALTATCDRQRRYRRWVVRLWLYFALPAMVALAVLERPGALVALPIELRPLAAWLPRLAWVSGDRLLGLGGGIFIGVAIVLVMTRLRGGRPPRQIGDVAALLPRNRAELVLAGWLSISAGVSEELAFRLVLPLLLAIATGSALAGAAGGIMLFGAMHLYQGWSGVAATTVVGAALMVCYLASGALWLAMLLHVLLDLGGLVLRPALAGAWRR